MPATWPTMRQPLEDTVPEATAYPGAGAPCPIAVQWLRAGCDLEGQQAIDFLCFNAHDPRERYHAPNTIKIPGNIYLGRGSVLRSVLARKMMTIVEDTCGGHDTIFGCCSFELDDVRYGARNPRACQQNFESELARLGLDTTLVAPNVNFFMRSFPPWNPSESSMPFISPPHWRGRKHGD